MATNKILTEDDEVKTGGKDEEIVILETPPEKRAADADAGSGEVGADERNTNTETETDTELEGKSDDEREAIRERRRKEKVERKHRRDDAIARDKTEMEFLRKRNDDLERRLNGVETNIQASNVTSLDQRLTEAQREIKMAEDVIAKATAAGNGEDVVQAMRYRDQAISKVNQLTSHRQQATASRQEGLDPAVANHAQQFMAQNKWYDMQGRDEDSAIVLAIDSALVRDGYDPRSSEYWDELRKRAARRLPEKFSKAGADDPDDKAPARREARGGPSVASGREHVPESSRREVYISPERKAAMIEAGVWDDPVLRQRYVKRYAEYDRANPSRA